MTNAGALFADACPLWQSRLYCTRWDGKEKSDAINDAERTVLEAMVNPFIHRDYTVMVQLDYMEKRGSGLTLNSKP